MLKSLNRNFYLQLSKVCGKLHKIKTYEKRKNCSRFRNSCSNFIYSSTYLGCCALYSEVLVNHMTKLHHQHA